MEKNQKVSPTGGDLEGACITNVRWIVTQADSLIRIYFVISL
jgi:hypothetical protein